MIIPAARGERGNVLSLFSLSAVPAGLCRAEIEVGTMARHSSEARAESRDRSILEWYEALISAVVILVLVFSFFFRIIQVEGESMERTLYQGQKLIVWGAGYTPERGDVVIVDSYTSYGRPLVKRVIALGGDTVDIDFETGVVQVNGEVLDEPYLSEPTWLSYDVEFPITVPEGTVFLMGDNRNNSLDSRSSKVGCIDERDILGRVLLRFLPFEDFGVIK